MFVKVISFLVLTFTFLSCSSSIEETRKESETEEEGNYVFDIVPENVTEAKDESSDKTESYFLIQIGAFTIKQSAEDFAVESKAKLGKEVNVSYSGEVNLFVVRLDKKFLTKKEAESEKDKIKATEGFKDAWVVTISE